jgi:hypothetical protein
MAETRLISERLAPVSFTAGGGDASHPGVVAGVCICGLSSANGRDYPPDVLRKAATKYEGAQVYLDHVDGGGKSRGVREWFGEIRNVRSRPDGRPEGDLHYPAEHNFAAEFAGRATNFPRSLGLSHVVEAKTSRRDGREVVEEISRVESVDLVASPATNTSLKEERGTVPQTTLRAVVESFRDKLPAERQAACRKLLLLAEDDAATGALMGAPVDAPAEGAGADDAIDGAFKTLMHAQLDALLDESATLAQFLSNIRELFKTRAKVMGKSEPKADDGATPAEAKALDPDAVISECKGWQFSPTYEQGEHLRRIPHQDTRKLVVESMKAALKAAAGETPRSAPRPAGKVEEGAPAGAPKKRVTLD